MQILGLSNLITQDFWKNQIYIRMKGDKLRRVEDKCLFSRSFKG